MIAETSKQKVSPLPSLGDFLYLLVFLSPIILLPSFLFNDASVCWHLAVGDYVLTTGHVPHDDFISYTYHGKSWIAYYWLADVILSLTKKLAALNGIAVLISSIIATLFLVIYERCRRLGCNFFLTWVMVFIGVCASSIHWHSRPAVLSFVGTYIFATTLEDYYRGHSSFRRTAIALSATMLLWVNSHPAHIIGFAITAIYLAISLLESLFTEIKNHRQKRFQNTFQLATLFVILFIITLINPYGLAQHQYILDYLKQSHLVFYDEFMSPVFHGSIQTTCVELIYFLLITGLALARRRCSLPQLITVIAFAHLSLNATRNIPLFVIVALPLIAELFSNSSVSIFLFQNQETSQLQLCPLVSKVLNRWSLISQNVNEFEPLCRIHALPILVTLFYGIAALFGGNIFGREIMNCGFDPNKVPTTTLTCIKKFSLPIEHGFNRDNWGGYLYYQGGILDYIDDRADLFDESFSLEYGRIISLLPGWSDLLDKHKIQWVIFPKDHRFSNCLLEHPGWKVACEDKAAYLFVRKSPLSTRPKKSNLKSPGV